MVSRPFAPELYGAAHLAAMLACIVLLSLFPGLASAGVTYTDASLCAMTSASNGSAPVLRQESITTTASRSEVTALSQTSSGPLASAKFALDLDLDDDSLELTGRLDLSHTSSYSGSVSGRLTGDECHAAYEGRVKFNVDVPTTALVTMYLDWETSGGTGGGLARIIAPSNAILATASDGAPFSGLIEFQPNQNADYYVLLSNPNLSAQAAAGAASGRLDLKIRIDFSPTPCAVALNTGIHWSETCLDEGDPTKDCALIQFDSAPYSLAAAAAACGVDHFNWINVITVENFSDLCLANPRPPGFTCADFIAELSPDPAAYCAAAARPCECDGLADMNHQPLVAPTSDPLFGGQCYEAFLRNNSKFAVADFFDWYWDEGPCPGPDSKCIDELTGHTSGSVLTFVDQPSLSEPYFFEFATMLTGVYANNGWKIVEEPGVRTLARWRYTGSNDDIGFFTGATPEESTGGAGTFEYLGAFVPEDLPDEVKSQIQAAGIPIAGGAPSVPGLSGVPILVLLGAIVGVSASVLWRRRR